MNWAVSTALPRGFVYKIEIFKKHTLQLRKPNVIRTIASLSGSYLARFRESESRASREVRGGAHR